MTDHSKIQIVILVILVTAFLFACPAIGVPGESETLPFITRHYSGRHGLPQNRITALLSSREGYIWVGTPSGLVRFDGVSFVSLYDPDRQLPAHLKINTLYEDATGKVCIGTDKGLFICGETVEKCADLASGLSNNHVTCITSDYSGVLWVGTEFGLNRFDRGRITTITRDDGLYDDIITALTIDFNGNLWIGTLRGGLARYKDKVEYVYGYRDGLDALHITCIRQDPMARLLIGTPSGLYIKEANQERISKIKGTDFTPVTSITQDAEGAYWFGTMNEGVKRSGDVFQPPENPGIRIDDNYVSAVISDMSGTVWAGTDAGGLVQIKRSEVKMISRGSGLPEAAATSVLQDRLGRLWIGTRNSGVCVAQKGKIIRMLSGGNELAGDRIRALWEDREGNIWIGTEDAGITVWSSNGRRYIGKNEGLSSDNITAIRQDRAGNIWIGTDMGLHSIDKHNRIRSFYEAFTVRTIYISDSNQVIIGTASGMKIVEGDRIRQLYPIGEETYPDVVSVYMDTAGIIWAGTNGDGMMILTTDTSAAFQMKEMLPDPYVFSIAEDQSGNLWMSSNQGIFSFKRDSVLAFLHGKSTRPAMTLIDENEGMTGRQCWGLGQPAVWKSADGCFFYPTLNGIARIKPENTQTGPVPAVLSEDIIDNKGSVKKDLEKGSSIDANELTFSITGFDYTAAEKIVFRYWLQEAGAHKIHWKFTRERRLTVSGLKAGDYRLHLRAIGNNGQQSDIVRSPLIKIRHPFFHSLEFYFVTSLVVFLSVAEIIRRRKRRAGAGPLEKYKTTVLQPETAKRVEEGIVRLMEAERMFLNPDLNLGDLAKRLNIHPNYLSRIINEKYGMKFNDFINKYRIDEVKKRFIDPAFDRKTVLEIMYDTGFFSKSVFNTAFRKFTGMTPTEFKKNTPHKK